MFPADLYQTMREVAPLKRYFVCPDFDLALEKLGRHLDLRILEFSPKVTVNRWIIPPSWQATEAVICRDGRVLYDATDHPMKIIAMSSPFEGVVTREELRAHLHYDHRRPDWIPFHFRQMYRPWDRTWGFCVPKRFYDELAEGSYEVRIRTEESDGPLRMADYTLPGERRETIVLVAHLDHPGMANDDLAGVIAGIRVMQLLAEHPRKFTYRLLITQEIIGSEYYLARMEATGEKEKFLLGLFLEMLGTRTPHALQLSHRGDTLLDFALKNVLRESGLPHRVSAFRDVICNDEANWEAHGITMPSLSRYPYAEYHSDKDTMDIISPEALEESAQLVVSALDRIVRSRLVTKKFHGVQCLSHPDFNLYVDAGQAAFASVPAAEILRLRKLMDLLPILLETMRTEDEIAEIVGLPLPVVREYLEKWEASGLIDLL